MIPGCFFSAIILFLWRFAIDLNGFLAITVIYGFVSGGMISLPPAIIANLTGDMSEVGARIGLSYTIAAFGALVGNPIAGAARSSPGPADSVDEVQRKYQGTWIFGGSFMVLATGLLLFTWRLKRRSDENLPTEEVGK